ncbi:MAG: universal stress protein [Nitrosopumilaceae archaeon]
MYKTILVPHGGTPAGDESLKHAINIAKSSSSKIILLHVVEELQYPPTFALSSSERESMRASIQSANYAMKKEMRQELEKKISACRENNIEAQIDVRIGFPADEIINVVKEHNVDLIVMAKRRKLKGVKKLLSLGSVSRKIVENVECPVLLIDIENL